MVGVINYDKLEQDFLDKVHQKAEQEFCQTVKDIEAEQEKIMEYLKGSWKECLKKLESEYQKLKETGMTGELCYGYLSFLRSGILGQTCWYRMDYYDSRDRISDIECGDTLEVSQALKRFYQAADAIKSLFSSQTRVNAYRSDKVIYQMAERFRAKLEPLLIEAFAQVLAEGGAGVKDSLTVKFFEGEFFAQVKPVAEWSNENPELHGA